MQYFFESFVTLKHPYLWLYKKKNFKAEIAFNIIPFKMFSRFPNIYKVWNMSALKVTLFKP